MTGTIRVLVFSELEMISSLHHGSGEDCACTDLPVLRDSRRIPFISGNSLAGSFGASLEETQGTKWLHPINDTNQEALPSLVTFDDAFPVKDQQEALKQPIEIREQVTQNRETQTALQDHHFNIEVLPVGTTFCFFCRFDATDTSEAEAFIKTIKHYLSKGGKYGGKRNAGLGHWKANKCGIKQLDLSDPKTNNDLKLWLTKGSGYEWEGDWSK